MVSLTAIAGDKRRNRRAASFLLASLMLGYAAIIYSADGDDAPRRSRSLTLEELANEEPEVDARFLAKTGADPPAADIIPDQYIVKPWVGNAAEDVYEDLDDTAILLSSAQASSVMTADYIPRLVLDDPNLATRWASSKTAGTDEEWITVDMGGPQNIREVYVKWWDAYAVDYDIEVARAREGCRSDGRPCPDAWIPVGSVTGKANSDATNDSWEDDDHLMQGVRYLRLSLKTRAPGFDNFSIYYIRIYRKPEIIGDSTTATACGATVQAAADALLAQYGGSTIQVYENAEFFAATMTEAQKDAMFEDPCVFTVEPNYIVRSMGRTTTRGGAEWNKQHAHDLRNEEEHHRRLAIPEFNLRDENPANWGLERISSHGRLNGKYTWTHEGTDTHIYFFDTGIYPDHSEWEGRDGESRLAEGLICAGTPTDYLTNDHGTHMASIAAGYTMGTAKDATIHPIQVLDANGEGSTATVLCGVEKLLQDGKDYNALNAPRRIRAVVNLSLGMNGRSDAMDKAVKDLANEGYLVVIAAGDHAGNACFYSPYDNRAVTVGAVSNHELGENDKTTTSNYGECIDVWAPGEDIYGATNTGEYEGTLKAGTSVAAAFAAGSGALFYEEVNTEMWEIEDFSVRVKEKIMNKAEMNILEDIGHGSANTMLQTTAVRCLINAHCRSGLTCIRDGSCVDLTAPLRPRMRGDKEAFFQLDEAKDDSNAALYEGGN